MDYLKLWENSEYSGIRVFEENSEPWFVGKDICNFFGDTNHNRTLSRVDDCDKRTLKIRDSLGRIQRVISVNESGVYSILFAMRPQKANNGGVSDAYPIKVQERIEKVHRFKRWVTSEVIPSIRKNGGYLAGQESMSDAEIMAKALLVAQKTIEHKQAQIETMQPKAVFADAVSASKTSILVGELAKILKQNGVDTGEKRLFSWLRENGYLIRRKGTDHNMPTQRSIEQGLFTIKETAITHGDGHVTVNKTPKVTGKGQTYFINLFLGERKPA